jgi:hypothetical protein
MNVLQTVVGDEGGPIPGQMTYVNEKLRNAIVQFLIVDNVPENGLSPSPDFVNAPIQAMITRNNPWVLGNKLIVVYTNCNCK